MFLLAVNQLIRPFKWKKAYWFQDVLVLVYQCSATVSVNPLRNIFWGQNVFKRIFVYSHVYMLSYGLYNLMLLVFLISTWFTLCLSFANLSFIWTNYLKVSMYVIAYWFHRIYYYPYNVKNPTFLNR